MFSTLFQTLCALDTTTYPGNWKNDARDKELERVNKELDTMYRGIRLNMWLERSSDEPADEPVDEPVGEPIVNDDLIILINKIYKGPSPASVIQGALRGWMERRTLKKADQDISSFVNTSDVSSALELDHLKQLREVVARVELLEEENRKLRTALKEKSLEMDYEQHQHILAEIHLRSKKKVDLVPIGLDSKLI